MVVVFSRPPWYRSKVTIAAKAGGHCISEASLKQKQKTNTKGLSRRVRFPEDETRLPWLTMLLDAYAITDTGVAIAVREQGKRQGRELACGKGCGNCCIHQQDLPLYPHELVGIYWYVSEKTDPAARTIIAGRIEDGIAGRGCLFLIDGSCSIHPIRPIGCRQFNVFSTPCAPGEDPFFTRRNDVLTPLADYTDRAFAAVLPFYQMKRNGDIDGAVRLVRSQIMNLRSFDWSRLLAVIRQAQTRKP